MGEFSSINDGPSVPQRTSRGLSPRTLAQQGSGATPCGFFLGGPWSQRGVGSVVSSSFGDKMGSLEVMSSFRLRSHRAIADLACDTRQPLPPSGLRAPRARTWPSLQPQPDRWHTLRDRASVARPPSHRPAAAASLLLSPEGAAQGTRGPVGGPEALFRGNRGFSQEEGEPGAGPLLTNALPGKGHCRAPLGQRTQENYKELKGGREAGVRGGPLPTRPSPLHHLCCAPLKPTVLYVGHT